MAHRLYVVDQLSWKEIAERTGVNRKTLEAIGFRNRWIEAKRGASKAVEVKTNARIRAEIDEVVEAVAIQTEELSLGTLTKARVTLDREDMNAARDLQAYSQAAKNFVGMARQARNLDNEIKGERSNGNVLVFVTNLERVAPRDAVAMAKPVIELAPAAAPLPALP